MVEGEDDAATAAVVFGKQGGVEEELAGVALVAEAQRVVWVKGK